ncbi:hypothetical protein ACLESD_16365, partial [Pyxidicoccus sp. 3LFB2]
RGSAYAREHGPAGLAPALDAVDTGARHGHRALDINNRVRHHMLDAVQSGGHTLNGAVHDAVVDPVGTGEKVLDAGRTAVDLLKLQEQVEKLGPNDSFKLEATVSGAAFGVEGSLGGTLTMSQNEAGQYVLRAEGRLGAALASKSGTSGAAKGEASLSAGNTAAVEFTFDNPSDLVEASRTFLGPTGVASALLEGGTGEAVDALTPDFGLLTENISAVELGTDITAKLQGELGADLAAGLKGNITGKLQYGARIEFPNGREGPPQVVLRGSAQLTAEGFATLGATAPGGRGRAGVVGGQGTVIVEHRFPLPKELGLGDVVSDPLGSAEQLVETARNKATTSVELRGRVIGGAGVSGGAPAVTQTSIKLTGDTGTIAGALPELLSGDYTGAFEELEDVTVKASVARGTETKLGADVGGGDGANSASVSFTGTAYDQTETVFTYEGTVEEGLGQLSRLPAYLANIRG